MTQFDVKSPVDLIKGISQMTVKEILEAIKEAEEQWGISAAAPVAAAAPAAAAAAPEAQEEKTEFTVFLTGFGEKKVGVIKEIRTITGLSLGDAKAAVEGTANAPYEVKADIPKEEAEKIKKQLQDAGASVEVK
jgi:large subunit ribosomal protein L7/L12